MAAKGSLSKDFLVSQQWTPDLAEALEGFFKQIVKTVPAVLVGGYVGLGRIQTIPLRGLSADPSMVILQPVAGGTPHITLVPSLSGELTDWSTKGLTLKAGSTFNTAGASYRFLVLA